MYTFLCLFFGRVCISFTFDKTRGKFVVCNFKQEIGDDLSVCVVNLLPVVSTLPSLVAISLMKVEM